MQEDAYTLPSDTDAAVAKVVNVVQSKHNELVLEAMKPMVANAQATTMGLFVFLEYEMKMNFSLSLGAARGATCAAVEFQTKNSAARARAISPRLVSNP